MKQSILRKLAVMHRNAGVRAEHMLLAGAIWCLFGVRSLTLPPPDQVPSVIHLLIPPMTTGALWIVTGLAAMLLAPFRRGSDWGLLLLIVQPGLRMFSYAYAWIAELIPGPPPGDPQGWYLASLYLAMVLWTRLISRIGADVRAPLSGRRRISRGERLAP